MRDLGLPAEPMAALSEATGRARVVVDPALLGLAQRCIDSVLADGPRPDPRDAREADVLVVLEQMLLDVANLDDDVARRADRHFPPGGLSDVVTASYLLEAATRLRIATALLGA
ncbi:MAG: hypothetical protein ACYC0W_09025 [Candidatus Nanopelagicales bacterium]